MIYTALVLSIEMVVALVAGSPEYWPKRRAMLAVLRVACALTPVFRTHARFVLQASWAPAIACQACMPANPQCYNKPALLSAGSCLLSLPGVSGRRVTSAAA